MQRLAVRTIDDSSIPELDPFRNLKDRHLRACDGLFVAEGLEVVRRLLQSDLRTHSLLLTPKKLSRLQDDIPDNIPVFVGDLDQIESVAGFNVHRGALACGYRPLNPQLSCVADLDYRRKPVVVLEGVTDAQNIGVIIRNAAAFGAPLIIMASCCDPFYRRSIRVSMGNVFRLPIYRSDDLARDLDILRKDYGFTLVAAVTSDRAIPLDRVNPMERSAVVFGTEGYGLSAKIEDMCDQHAVIPMAPGSDSINVAVASGIFLHHFTR